MEMKDGFLPCPYCGGEAEYEQVFDWGGDGSEIYWERMTCIDCGAEVQSEERDGAIEKWNRRSSEWIGWISCKKKLPDMYRNSASGKMMSKKVVVAIKVPFGPSGKIYYDEAYLVEGDWNCSTLTMFESSNVHCEVTHWTSIPEWRKEEELCRFEQ